MYSLKNYLKIVFGTSVLSVIFVYIFSIVALSNIKEDLERQYEVLIKYNIHSIEVLCELNNCNYISVDKQVIIGDSNAVNEAGIGFDGVKIVGVDSLSILLDNYNITIGMTSSVVSSNIMVICFFAWLFTMVTITFIYIHINVRLNNTLTNNTRAMELELESKLQRVIAEHAHHEMLQPVAITKSLIGAVLDELNIFLYSEKSRCNRCSLNGVELEIIGDPETLKLYQDKINLHIERLEAVLFQMSETKQLKYGSEIIAIRKLILNIMAGVNSYNFNKSSNKIECELVDEDNYLDTYSVSSTLTSGKFLNILNNHITNSKEANATKIKVEVRKLNSGYLSILLEDNGNGIRDVHGDIINVSEIFEAGYTTKDKTGKNVIVKKRYCNKIKSYIHKKLGIKDSNIISPRGVGLFINRSLMRESGGDIELVSTSPHGTTFKLKIPVMKIDT